VLRAVVDSNRVFSGVDAYSDEETTEFSARIDTAPAGADVSGILFVVFFVFLIADILGRTKVVPYPHPVP